jgi:hypothetical protein
VKRTLVAPGGRGGGMENKIGGQVYSPNSAESEGIRKCRLNRIEQVE